MNLKIVRFIDIYIGIPFAYLLLSFKRIGALFIRTKCDSKNIRRVLLVKFWGIGNVIMLLPSAHSIKKRYPLAKLDFLTLDKNKDVSLDAHIFDNIYTLNQDSILKFIMTGLRAIWILSKQDYDIIVDFEQFARFSAIFCNIIGRREIMGFKTDGQHRDFLYTKSITYNNHIHMTRSFLTLAEAAGAVHEESIHAIKITYATRDFKETKELLSRFGFSEQDMLIILHMGTSDNFSLRRWPVASFAELANRLIEDYNAKIIFTGLAEEDVLIKKAIDYIVNKDNIIDACGLLNFNQFVAMVKMSDLVVSCDTSAVHIASCLSTPVVGLYGPNTPVLYGPWNEQSIYFYKELKCSPCITNYNAKINKCNNPNGKGACMQAIGVDEVYNGIVENYLRQDAQFKIKQQG